VPRRLTRLHPVALFVTLVTLLLPQVGRAERPSAPELLPEDTLVYARVANISETAGKFQETGFAKMFRDPQIKPLVDQLYGEALTAFQVVEDELGLSLSDILSIPQGELCVAVIAQSDSQPAIVAYLDVGDSMDKMNKLIDRGLQELSANGGNYVSGTYRDTEILTISPTGRGRPIKLIRRDETILFATSDAAAEQILDAWDDRDEERTKLIENKKFTTVMKRCVGTKDERPQITWFIDPIRIVRTVTRGNLGAAVALSMLDPLGLENLEAVGGSVILSTEEFDSIGHFHVMMKQPREAILKMIALKKVDTTPESWVPKDASSYMTMQWEFEQTFTELSSLYDLIRLEEGAFSNLVRSRTAEPLGLDIEEDLIPELAGRVTMFTRVERPARLNSQVSAANIHFNDAASAKRILEKLVDKFPNAFEKQSYGANRYYRLGGVGGGNENLDASLFRQPTPVVCQIENCIMIADSEKLLEMCFQSKGGAGESLADDLEYKLVISRLGRQPGGSNPSMIAFGRPEEQLRVFYELATANSTRNQLSLAAENNPFFGRLDSALNDNPLPPFSQLAKYLAPSGGIVTNEATGIHYIAFGMKRE